VGSAGRSFSQALIHLLETDYGILGSQKVLELLARDVQQLVEQFYPAPERMSAGWMIYTGTRAKGKKAYPGQPNSEFELVTLAWPVLLPEDLTYRASHPDTKANLDIWLRQRMVRIVEHGLSQSDGAVVLTLADLGAMLGLDTAVASHLLSQARKETGKELPTKGYYFDQGMRPTHKEEIIALYESGLDEAEVARRSQHAQGSVGQYLRDYENVKLLLKTGLSVKEIPNLINMQPNVVQAYVKLVRKYHPELISAQVGEIQTHKD
jgi:DNA-binding CsgD family transcriptional regulator